VELRRPLGNLLRPDQLVTQARGVSLISLSDNLTVRVRRLAAGLALVALAGCGKAGDLVTTDPAEGPSESPTTQSSEDSAGAAAPKMGACRQLVLEDIAPPTNDTPTVPCRKRHTAETYYVGAWPKQLVTAASGLDDQALEDYVFEQCDRAWRRTVGGSLEEWVISIVSWAWYRPTEEQFDDGARWFRCDVVAGQNTDRLEKLPPSVDGLLDGGFSDRYHACWTRVFSDKPGVDEGELTSCERAHEQRAVGIVTIGKKNEVYPGQQSAFERSNDGCADAVAAWRGDPRPGEFGLQWPRRDEWVDGQRYATCWAVTRR
jgi:Septum formation